MYYQRLCFIFVAFIGMQTELTIIKEMVAFV